jgi:hypothetical protein
LVAILDFLWEDVMRLSKELSRELEERLSTIKNERQSDPAYRDLPAPDDWAFRLLVLAGILGLFLL